MSHNVIYIARYLLYELVPFKINKAPFKKTVTGFKLYEYRG